MEKLTLPDLIRIRDLNEKFISGDEEHGQRMYYGLMAGKNISNIIFPHMGDLSCHVTHNAYFENVLFIDIQFLGTDLGFTTFKNCVFANCSIIKADFFQSKFQNVIFSNSKLFRSKFIQTTIIDCIFKDNDLSRISLSESKISNTIFIGETEKPNVNNNEEHNVVWEITTPVHKQSK